MTGTKRVRPLYGFYERRLTRQLVAGRLPQHIGVQCDGNRRWARMFGEDIEEGYVAGADKVSELLTWCDEMNIQVVTLWLLSTDNLQRSDEEVVPLLRVIEGLVERLAAHGRWRLRLIGALELLPADYVERLRATVEGSADATGPVVNIAVAYGGRRELTDAFRGLLREKASQGMSLEEIVDDLDVADIADHLYTSGQPDPDLVIRTSGEQRMSGFLLWQSVHSEFYFCEVMWPAFRRTDFLRALRSFADRERRFGA